MIQEEGDGSNGANGRIQVISNPLKLQDLFRDLINSAQKEILLVLLTSGAFHREEKVGIIDYLDSVVRQRSVRIRIITPTDPATNGKIQTDEGKKSSQERDVEEHTISKSPSLTSTKSAIKFRQVAKLSADRNVTILIVDRRASLAIELKDDTKSNFLDAMGMGIYSTSSPTIRSYISFFEALWHESELRESETLAKFGEEKNRRQAELLQNILTHDVRNYNQVARLSGEILRDRLKGNEDLQLVADSLLGAVDASNALVDRAKTLGRIISQKNTAFYPVNLSQSLERALTSAKKIFPHKTIIVETTGDRFQYRQYLIANSQGGKAEADIEGKERTQNERGLISVAKAEYYVLADDLLDEVFVNIFSNSIRYTEGDTVRIWIEARPEEEAGGEGDSPFYKISIADAGAGMPDEQKDALFSRYVKSAKGYSLGMSIIHALAVERYNGKIRIENRIKGDYTKGTLVELSLQRV